MHHVFHLSSLYAEINTSSPGGKGGEGREFESIYKTVYSYYIWCIITRSVFAWLGQYTKILITLLHLFPIDIVQCSMFSTLQDIFNSCTKCFNNDFKLFNNIFKFFNILNLSKMVFLHSTKLLIKLKKKLLIYHIRLECFVKQAKQSVEPHICSNMKVCRVCVLQLQQHEGV